jgi:DNA-binding transcriptional ArsR family regulator
MSFTPSMERRTLRDPRAMRALAHPARLAILERLASGGPATATECAEVTGQSPSACSYHLRALARWGLVDESEGHDRRERRWAVTGPFVIGDHDEPRRADVAAAEHALTAQVLDRATTRALDWLDHSDDEPREWREATLIANRTLRLTADELTDVLEQIERLCAPYLASSRGDDAPAGSRSIHLHLSAVPSMPAQPSPSSPSRPSRPSSRS